MYVIEGACSCVSFIARGVREQKYNPKTGLRLRHCEEGIKSDEAISSPTLRHCEERSARRGNLSFNQSKYKAVDSRSSGEIRAKKSSAEAELNLKNKWLLFIFSPRDRMA